MDHYDIGKTGNDRSMVIKSGGEIIHNHLGGFSFILNFDMTEVTTFLPLTDPFYDYFVRFSEFFAF